MSCNKLRYKSKRSANKALRIQQRYNVPVKRVYFCKECGAWHLSSRKLYNKKMRSVDKHRKQIGANHLNNIGKCNIDADNLLHLYKEDE